MCDHFKFCRYKVLKNIDGCHVHNLTPPRSLESKCDCFQNLSRRSLSPDFDAVIATTSPGGVVPTGSTGKHMSTRMRSARCPGNSQRGL